MTANATKHKRRPKKDDRRHFAMSIEEVTAEFNRRHGTDYGSAWIGMILRAAEKKIARGLRRDSVDAGDAR